MSYQKQTFVNNETVLMKQHLDHIEDGISNNDAAITQLSQQVQGSAVIYSAAQNLTDGQKTQARTNIGAESAGVVAIQDNQPTDTSNKIWLQQTMEEGVQVPTLSEFQEVEDDISDLKSAFVNGTEQITGCTPLVFQKGQYRVYNDNTVSDLSVPVTSTETSQKMVCAKCACVAGDVFTVKARGLGTAASAVGFFDADFKGIYRAGTSTLYDNTIVAPANAAWFAVNHDVVEYPDVEYYAYSGDAIPKLLDITQNEIDHYANGVKEAGVNAVAFTRGAYAIPSVGETVDLSTVVIAPNGVEFMCAKCQITPGTWVHAYTRGSTTYRPYAFFDENYVCLSTSNTTALMLREAQAPDDSAWVVFNTFASVDYYAYIGDSIPSIIANKQDALTFDNVPTGGSANPVTSGGIYNYIVDNPQDGVLYDWRNGIGSPNGSGWRTGYYYVQDGSYHTSSSYCCTAKLMNTPFYGYDYFVVTPPANKAIRTLVVEYAGATTDTWIRTYGENNNSNNGVRRIIPITPGHYYAITVGGADQSVSECENITLRLYKKKARPFEGLKVSLLGDSISALSGFIPTGNARYYTGSSYGVDGASKMWWNIAIFGAGGTPLIMDAWSGSCIASGVREPTSGNTYLAMSDVSRCQNLHSWRHGDAEHYDLIVDSDNIGTLRKSPWYTDEADYQIGDYLLEDDPDVVIVTGGGNDYSYNCPLGTYDGHSLVDVDNTADFRSAYANIINRIQRKYPYALVVCCVPFWLLRPSRSTTNTKDQTNINSIGNSYLDYQNVIREIAHLKACPIIDLFTSGFSRFNYYNAFAEDSETSPTHPNSVGQQIIGLNVLKQLENLPGGYLQWLKENR